MPIKPTYPGLYIEELPATSFTINPAPTSVTVLIGYAHPFRTRPENFGRALPLASFTEFERAFGGYVASPVFDGNLALAAGQFFMNGGSELYAVGLRPRFHAPGGGDVPGTAVAASDTSVAPVDVADLMNPVHEFQKAGAGPKLVAVGLEPDHPEMPLNVEFTPKVSPARADIRVTYGTRVETFRDVEPTDASVIEKVNGVSALVRFRQGTAGSWPADFDFKSNTTPAGAALAPPTLPADATVYAAQDFTDVFKDDTELDKVDVFNLMAIPGVTAGAVLGPALAFCERKLAFFVMDPPPTTSSTDPPPAAIEKLMSEGGIEKSTNGAIYFPPLAALHPVTGDPIELPPSGTVAGVYARTDTQFGVWKAPAGVDAGVRGATGVAADGRLTDMRHGRLNMVGVNALRTFPGVGTVVFGARTLHGGDKDTAYQQWKYVPVRRMALFIEQTLKANLTWVVFRPNDEPLWAAIRATIGNFMLSLFRQGALQGGSPSQAFRVKVDEETTTPDDVNNGRVNIVVAFAPLKPAEFVVIQIAQLAGQTAA